MKAIFTKQLLALPLGLTVCATSATAAQITGAVADPENRQLIVGVKHTGCNPVPFDIQIDECKESYPVQCTARLIEATNPGQGGEQCQMEMEYVTYLDIDQYDLDRDL